MERILRTVKEHNMKSVTCLVYENDPESYSNCIFIIKLYYSLKSKSETLLVISITSFQFSNHCIRVSGLVIVVKTTTC